MKLTKGMKKALSLLLSAAMVVTGVNVTANTASAEEAAAPTSYKVSVVAQSGKTAGTVTGDAKAGDDGKLSWDQGWGDDVKEGTAFKLSVDAMKGIKNFGKPVVKLTASEGAQVKIWENTWGSLGNGTDVTADGLDLTETVKSDKWDPDSLEYGFWVSGGSTVDFEIIDASIPQPGTAFIMFGAKGWGPAFGNWNTVAGGGHGREAMITGNGTYTVSLNKEDYPDDADTSAVSGAQVFCVDMIGLAASKTMDTTRAMVSDVKIKVDGKDFKADQSKMYFGRIESQNTNLRLEICNSEGYKEGDFNTADEFDNDSFKFEESLSVTFTLSGIVEGQETPEDAYGEDRTPGIPGVEPVVPTKAPVETPAATATATAKAPAKTPTASAIATKSTITTPVAVGTSKITPKQKTVVVAPNKTVKVGFTATAAKPATKAAVVTATTASKKVATAKVSGKKVVIKAPKKAVKGSSTTVTLKSTNGDKKVSAKIKVYVRNSAKKVKAAKKAITVKKGKTTKLVIKASKVQNKKKAFADTITVKGKIVKLTDVKFAKGKATLTLKGVKKAKKKAVTIKVGSKSVKVKATVK